MEQKDYKAISEIMSKHLDDFGIAEGTVLCNRLANYFEREAETKEGICQDCGQAIYSGNYAYHNADHSIKWNNEFNREQFLKDCGVQ